MRYGLFTVALLLMVPTASAAQPAEEKLDAILTELRALNQRVTELENRLSAIESELTKSKPAKVKPAPAPNSRRLLRPLELGPKEILRMQNEEPGALLKNVHERERQLRKRVFLPELF